MSKLYFSKRRAKGSPLFKERKIELYLSPLLSLNTL